MKNRILLTLIGFSFLFLPLQAQTNLVLDVFSWQGNNGAYPYGSPVISGSTLYGMTYQGGSCAEHGEGTIFKVQLDGTGFTRLHEFCDQDGSYPYGSLIISGSTLFGMTTGGGSSDSGTIFKIETDGNGFLLMHKFAGHPWGGAQPHGSLLFLGSTLYGMTSGGGFHASGIVFSIDPSARDIIHVNAPVGGETWKAGSSHDITWTTTGTIASVNIDYSLDNNSNWIPVAADIANNEIPPQTSIRPSTTANRKNFQFSSSDPLSTMVGTAGVNHYSWIVPDTPSPSCLIRIRDAARASTSGISNAVFSILMNLDLQAERLEVKSFSMVKQYGQIQFMGGQQNAAVAEYRIMRRRGSDAFTVLRTVLLSELQNNQFQMQDKYLEKNIQYTYLVEAYNAAGQLVGRSAEKTI